MKKLILTILATFMLVITVGCANNDLVKVKVDAFFFEGASEEEIVAEAKELGLSFYTINADGSVTYEIEKQHYDEILANYKTNLQVIIDEFTDGEEKIPSFNHIEVSDNLDKFTIIVNDYYTGMDSMMAMPFMVLGAYYQNFMGLSLKNIDVVIEFVHYDTKEVLDSLSFKELFNE